ncbi:hypothetical protein Ahy_B01g056512 [Arachis hypogaea]|uniref:Uncharacterized protein n=1 Tax=Arachis hypogaea TaxID=3818 RepID=A0A445AZ49_ARAHY|nr:hypothetical protein Ahy_B01g056512 [Arachis hypogaea]
MIEETKEVSSNFQENVIPEVEEDPMTNETLVAETTFILIGASQADDQRDVIVLDGIGSFGAIDFDALRAGEIMMIECVDLKTTYNFYSEYGRIKGRCKKAESEGDIIWQIFVCSRQGE